MAQKLVEAQQVNLYPDGAFAYIGAQNESCGYHDLDIALLARYYLISQDDKAKAMLTQSAWYGPVSCEPGMVADYWTAPSWKHFWNGTYSTGTEVVAGLSGNPYLRGLLDQEIKLKGGKPDPLLAMFYRTSDAKVLPDNYTVLDRNIIGVRARYGKFSYAITGRVPGRDEPGKDTLAGAMILDDPSDKEPYPLNAALMSATPEVLLRKGATDRDKRGQVHPGRNDFCHRQQILRRSFPPTSPSKPSMARKKEKTHPGA